MSQTVLITGGTGLIGRRLTELLLQNGYQVALLSRKVRPDGKDFRPVVTTAKPASNVHVYQWDIQKGNIDPRAIQTADHIVHLAGEGVADKRWTEARKQEILTSRTEPTELLVQALSRNPHHVQSFIGASAIGYYGDDTGDRPLTETSEGGTDFLAQVTRAWERAEDKVAALGIRTVKLRIGVVLTMQGGALPKLVQPIRLGAGAPIGSGQQYISWIHLDDLCRLIMATLPNSSWQGVYNAVAPAPVTNETFIQTAAQVMHRPLLLPNIPTFAIRLLYGELATAVTGGNYVLNKRVADETDFAYQYADLTEALENLLP